MSWLSDLIGNGAGDIIDSITDGVDKFITTDEEKQELALKKQEMQLKIRQMQIDADKKYYEDRQSARSMQMETKSKIPGALTIIFTVAFFGLIAFILILLFDKLDVQIPNYIVALISTIFGSVATIMTQIISFYFGSSKSGDEQNERMTNAVSRATTENNKKKEAN